ncbi:MAG: Ig-like domain-containing protein [Acidobacteriota bacterium]
MRPLKNASTAVHRRRGLLVGLAIVAVAAIGCERALQVAPTDSELYLTAAASAVPLNGSLQVTATLTSNGAAVADGTLVNFTSTLGTLDPTEATTANGRTTVRLLAGSVAGIARLVASSGALQSSTLEVRVGSVPNRILLSVSRSAPGSATVVATVFDTAGVAVEGVPVTFTTTAGSLATGSVNTDSFGQAATTLFATTDAVVAASAGTVQSSIPVSAAIGGGAGTLNVNIAMNPTAPKRGQTITFTATVTSAGGTTAPVERFEWEFSTGETVTTTGNILNRAYIYQGLYTLVLRVYGPGGALGLSRIDFYVD